MQRLGNKAQAATMLQNLAEVKSSGSAQEFYVAGLAERFRGQEQIAESYFQQALTKDPGMWNARFALRGE